MNLSLKQAELTLKAIGWNAVSRRDESNMKIIDATKGHAHFIVFTAGGVMGQFTIIEQPTGKRYHCKPADFVSFFNKY